MRPLLRAAQYVRMSTEHQRYSIEYQMQANARRAASLGCEIVRTYADAGVSGLTLEKRQGLTQLLADVMSGDPGYDIVVVYDVSRWGRFQDPDESAHYEFLCRAAGVRLEYSAEPFENDGSMASAILKTMKRAMAAEYVRELSLKVRAAKMGLGEQGYWTGGSTPYGYRRCMVSPDGAQTVVLEPWSRKALQGHRVVLVAGPGEEVATVRRIYRLYVVEGLRFLAIAERLNAEGIGAGYGKAWTPLRVRRVLSNEKYIGNLIIGRYASYLKRQVVNPRSRWRRVVGGCPALVERKLFEAAQANLPRLKARVSDEALLEELRAVLARHGRLSENVIQSDPDARTGSLYARRFGSLTRAFELIGYVRTPAQEKMLEKLRRVRPHLRRTYPHRYTAEGLLEKLAALYAAKGYLNSDLIDAAPGMPNPGTYRSYFGSLGRAYELIGYPANARQRQVSTRGP